MKKARQKSVPAPAPPPVTAGLIVASMLSTNNLVFGRLLPLAEQELATVFDGEGFEPCALSEAAARIADQASREFPGGRDAGHPEGWPHEHAEAGFALGLLVGLRLAGAR